MGQIEVSRSSALARVETKNTQNGSDQGRAQEEKEGGASLFKAPGIRAPLSRRSQKGKKSAPLKDFIEQRGEK